MRPCTDLFEKLDISTHTHTNWESSELMVSRVIHWVRCHAFPHRSTHQPLVFLPSSLRDRPHFPRPRLNQSEILFIIFAFAIIGVLSDMQSLSETINRARAWSGVDPGCPTRAWCGDGVVLMPTRAWNDNYDIFQCCARAWTTTMLFSRVVFVSRRSTM